MAKVVDHRVRALAALAERSRRSPSANQAAKRIHAEIERLHTGAEALGRLAAQRSPLETESAHVKRVAAAAKRFTEEVQAATRRAAEAGESGLKAIAARIDERVDLRPDAFAGEVRSAFRKLDREGKVAALQRMVDQNSGPELAAIVRAPELAVGLSREEQAQWEKVITAKHAAAELDERAEIEEAWEAVTTAESTAAQLAKILDNPVELARIEQEEAAAAAAADDFANSMQ